MKLLSMIMAAMFAVASVSAIAQDKKNTDKKGTATEKKADKAEKAKKGGKSEEKKK